MSLTQWQLLQILPNASPVAGVFVSVLNTAMNRYQIIGIKRIAAFIAQIGHESGQLRYLKEVWGPTAAQARYEGRAALGTFGLLMLLSRAGFDADNIADFKGLGKRSGWFALMMTIMMFSMAGVPPLVGFAAKFSVLNAVLGTGQVWLTVVAVMFSLIGAFYYLRIVKTMWFDEPTDSAPRTWRQSLPAAARRPSRTS